MKSYYYLIALIVLGGIIYFIYVSDTPINLVQKSLCKTEEMAKAEIINGMVVNKTLDTDNHNYRTVIYKDGDRVRRTYIFDLDLNEGFEIVKIGDSIIKESGVLEITIVNQSGENYKHSLRFGCK
ncbi:hypothetical protein [Algoriphagus namhaensis]